jgi:cell division protein FtsQ
MSRLNQKRRKRKHGRRTEAGHGLLPRLGGLFSGLIVVAAVGFFARATLAGLSGAADFTVEVVRVEGTRFLDPAELLASAQPEQLNAEAVGPEDFEILGERIALHPLIERVAVRRSLPASVIIEVEERVPVAFLSSSPVRGIDRTGRVLKGIEPGRYGSLPFVTGLPENPEARSEALRRTADVLARMQEEAPRLHDRTSEAQALKNGEIVLVLTRDAVRVRLEESRLAELLPLVGALIEEGRRLHPDLIEIDLRFADTVIYRKRNESR